MVRQIVLVRWTEDATEQMKQGVADALRGLQTQIDGIRDMRMGSDLGVRDENFDFAVSVDFDSADDYLTYREHPAHLKVVTGVIRPVMAERAGTVFDC